MLAAMPLMPSRSSLYAKAAIAGLALGLALPGMVGAQGQVSSLDEVVGVSVLPGWRVDQSRHISAISIDLAPGWKTYWRSPGDGGLPSEFNWDGSVNLAHATISWPHPQVFHDFGRRSIGYADQVVLPVTLTPQEPGDILLNLEMRFGICKEICIPAEAHIDLVLADAPATPDPRIQRSLERRPRSGQEFGVSDIACQLAPSGGGYQLSVSFSAPQLPGENEALVIEAGNPEIWMSEPKVQRSGDSVQATATMHLGPETAQADLSQMRFTMISTQLSVEKTGCSPG